MCGCQSNADGGPLLSGSLDPAYAATGSPPSGAIDAGAGAGSSPKFRLFHSKGFWILAAIVVLVLFSRRGKSE